jgi:peroxiredoxin
MRNHQHIKGIVLATVCLLLTATLGWSQGIRGQFPQLAGQSIVLRGFAGLHTYTIDSTTVAADGTFRLAYTARDYGMGLLSTAGQQPYIVVLSQEDMQLKGEQLHLPQTVQTLSGAEQRSFVQYATEQPKREQVLSAWTFLEQSYQADSLFAESTATRTAIAVEKQRLRTEEQAFLSQLSEMSYVRWYLPIRKLVSNVQTVAKYRPQEIPATIAAFRHLDYSDERLYKSGLLRNALEGHFWLLENSGVSLDKVYAEMKISVDAFLATLIHDEVKLNEIGDFLFDLLERHSLFEASEHLALQLLDSSSCTLNDDFAKQLETYRAMKVGNIAPDFQFSGTVLSAGKEINRLSDIKSNYQLVVFGASWCQKCTEEIPQLAQKYQQWKAVGMEVVLVSLDSDEAAYRHFAESFPFLSMCDFKMWKSPVVESYYVSATPTMYLLDNERKILLRPKSVAQVQAWMDMFAQ